MGGVSVVRVPPHTQMKGDYITKLAISMRVGCFDEI